MDILLLFILAALVITLATFLSGLFPYPYGWIALAAFLIARLSYLSRKR